MHCDQGLTPGEQFWIIKHGIKMTGMPSHGMLGAHTVPATVLSVDTTTGVLEVDANGLKLRLHFPPESLATVKAGDKIKVHMAFMK